MLKCPLQTAVSPLSLHYFSACSVTGRLLMADLGHATGARLLEEEHLEEVQQNEVSAPHIGSQCLQHHRHLTFDPCDLEELSDRDVASAAGSALHRDCRLPLPSGTLVGSFNLN